MHARVIRCTRRHFIALTDAGEEVEGKVLAKFMDLTVGDEIECHREGSEVGIDKVMDRRNSVTRSYLEKSKTLAANVDHLFVVAAIPPLFNAIFIDRIMVSAHQQQIPLTLVINKIDLGIEEVTPFIELYESLGISVLLTTAKTHDGISPLIEKLYDPSISLMLFSGISGVGKSTIYNRLFPEANHTTGAVSLKTGQGKQTTTHAYASIYERNGMPPLFIVDSPGLQQFGLTSISQFDVSQAFKEIRERTGSCKFNDCTHTVELGCAVRAAVEEDAIASSRYASYLHILRELALIKTY